MKSEFYFKLKQQWQKGLPFVIFSLPFHTHTTAFLQDNDRLTADSQLKNKGFAFGGFQLENQCYTIESDTVLTTEDYLVTDESIDFSIVDQGDRQRHIQTVQAAIEQIKSSTLEKVVVARAVKAHLKASPIAVYAKLNSNYPQAFTYCLFHPKLGLWYGASPELLVSTTDTTFKTVALAGTRWADLSDRWGTKELEEQQLVTRYIKGQLEDLKLNYHCSDVETIKAGKLLHLKQNFEGQLNDSQLIDLIRALHPTPAVCGLPADLANSFIKSNEELERSFYAGFMGPIGQFDDKGSTYSYLGVNIRCMQVLEDSAELYVGGGITADSDPALEWEETVKKSQTLSSIFD